MVTNLLIADGDAELCDLYARYLTDCGYEVETSADGLECLRKLRQLTPAAFVLDLDLQWGGGDGVLAWLREENPSHRIPVIITAAAGCPEVIADYIEPPVVRFLPKPFALTALLESVRSAIAINGRREPSNFHRVPVNSELFYG